MSQEFLKFEFVTLFGTWWGIIGCLLGPVYILTNLLEYLSGSFLIIRETAKLGIRRRPPLAHEGEKFEHSDGSRARLMIRNGSLRVFLAGTVSGVVLIAVVGAGLFWWKVSPERSAEDDAICDRCLMAQSGNTVACDAMIRLIHRERAALAAIEKRDSAAETALKKEAAQLLAAGFSKREVVQWAMERGFVGSQLSDAVGISLQDLQVGKY